MTTAFVPITVDVTGCRSCNNPSKKSGCSSRNCKPRSTSRSTPMVREVRSLEDPAVGPVERQIRRGESSHLEECSPNDSWVERPVTPTLLGYEIMEERSKFTVYKILVTGNQGSSWVIFRRYADFSRLNDKLKQLFPRFRLSLPPKRWFKDNYDMEFLEERQIGLQTFLQNLLAHKDIINSEAVRQFLCLDDPPNPFDRLEESRAFCETLEETNHRLQRELLEKQQEIDNLQIVIQERDTYIELLERKVSDAFLRKEMSDSPSQISVVSSDSCTCGEPEVARPDTYAEVRNDQQSHTEGNKEVLDGEMCSQTEADRESFDAPGPNKSHSAYWSTLVITDSPVPS